MEADGAPRNHEEGVPRFLSKERIVASPGYNRWWGIPAALLINLSIGQAYAFSVFNLPLTRAIGVTEHAPRDWRLTDIGWIFTLAYVFLGLSAGFAGTWQDRVGPRKSGVVATLCWSGGFYLAALGVHFHQIWMLYVGYGIIGGCGLGIGFNTPITTLIRWFPDRRGLATGMAIMGFGGGAIIAAPLSEWLMSRFESTSSVGVAETLVVLGTIYFVAMWTGSMLFRLPPPGWEAESGNRQAGQPGATQAANGASEEHDLTVRAAMRTSRFYLLWTVMLLNVTAGIGVLGQASAMIQEVFGGFSAAAAAGFVALLSLFNMGGRFLWAAFSDQIGRKAIYAIFFSLGPLLYACVPLCGHQGSVALFVGCFAIILTMYGGGFACLPAYVADVFGPRHVGAIHGRLLTALSVAGVLGPIIVNYVREYQIAAGVSTTLAYDRSMYIMAGVLVVGFFCNLAIRPRTGFQPAPGRDFESATSRPRWLAGVATALIAILGIGLLSGHFLGEFDENVGFHREADRIAQVLHLAPGMNVADIRAGTGKWTADIAKRVAPNGQVYATVGPDPAHVVYETIAAAGVDNVTVVIRTPGDQSRVPPTCCQAILMRAVYHEFDDRRRVTSDAYRALTPGGELAIIDFDEGTPEQLGGHGIARGTVIEEVTSVGFELREVIADWEGNAYCLVFRRPDEPEKRREGFPSQARASSVG